MATVPIDSGPAATPVPMPLCVDLDGTLIRTDLLHEAAIRFAAHHPWELWRLAVWAYRGRATLKHELATRIDIDATSLPYRRALIDHIAEHRARGGEAYLVTASPRRWAEAVADHLAMFDGIICSTDHLNLKGAAKASALVDRFGSGGFAYVGDGRQDKAVWASAGSALGAGNAATRFLTADARIFAEKGSLGTSTIRALRPHQWLKNLLIFVPLFTSHQIDSAATIISALAAFLAFCCCASNAYIVNDLLDLPSDRLHPRKSLRPFASGEVPVRVGVAIAPMLLVLAASFCLALPPIFAVVLTAYYVLTQAYSLTLKRRAPADVFTLASLYTIRVIAGAVAIGVALSLWLAAFSIFIFLSLATLKRHAELVDAASRGIDMAAGRGYWTSDGPVLVALGMASGFSAVLVMTLYVTQPYVVGLYRTPELLWLICPLMLYWVSRMWLLAQRRQMHDDPIVLAIRDSVSRNIILVSGGIATIAAKLKIPLPIIMV